MSTEWTDELRKKVVEMYLEREPTPENTIEICHEIAEEIGNGKTGNGIRRILQNANVYINKEAASKSTKESKGTRVSKADLIAALEDTIKEKGGEVDDTITSKLTGKAAQYFSDLINSL